MSSKGCTSSFRGRGRSTMKSVSHKSPTISNKSSPSDSKHDSLSTGHSKHGLESFGTAEGTPPPTIGVPGISPVASPVNDLPTPDQTPNSSEASTDNVLWVEGGHFMPEDHGPVKIIGLIVKSKIDGCWPTFSAVPENIKEQLWNTFKGNYVIPDGYEFAVKRHFRKKAGKLMRGNMWLAKRCFKKKKDEANWIDSTVWLKIHKHWASESFKKRSAANKANRHRISKDGLPVGKHTGGSRSAHDTRLVLEHELQRPVLGAELFAVMHTSKEDKNPIDDVARRIQQLFSKAVPEMEPFFCKKNAEIPKELRMKANTSYVQCVGGEVKGRIPGLGNVSKEFSTATSACPSFFPSNERVNELTQQVSQLTTENESLHEKLSEMEKRAAERDAETDAKIARLGLMLSQFMGSGMAGGMTDGKSVI